MKGYHILIVEDDVTIGDLLQKILQREGYHVMWKTDGADVLTVIQKVDLVIMDVMLPGEDGYQMSAKIKKLGLRIPVIFSRPAMIWTASSKVCRSVRIIW